MDKSVQMIIIINSFFKFEVEIAPRQVLNCHWQVNYVFKKKIIINNCKLSQELINFHFKDKFFMVELKKTFSLHILEYFSV